MDRTNGAGHVAHRYVSEDIATNRPPTELTPEAMNFLQEELVNLATILGDALNPASERQVRDVLIKALQQNRFKTATAAGTADAITAVFAPVIPLATLYNGMTLMVRAAAANATTTPTFTPNAGVIPAVQIVKEDNKPLAAGDIAGAGFWMKLTYDSLLDKWVLLNAKATTGSRTFTANDYDVLNNGLLVQWGQIAAGGSADNSATFPISFPVACLAVFTTSRGNGLFTVTADAISSSTFNYYRRQTTTGTPANDTSAARYFAIGF